MFVSRISYCVPSLRSRAGLRIASIFYNTGHGSHIRHTVAGLCTMVFLLSAAASSANALPTAEDINSLAEKVRLTIDTFMQESFEPRMKYEYSGKFLNPDDKENLHKLAKTARDRLRAIEKKQQGLKKQIEDYQGRDWDVKYGSTGLWRKLFADLYKTTLSKHEIDFYLALTAEQPQRNEILHRILGEIDSLNQTYKPSGPKLVKGKVLALLAQTEPLYKAAAIKELKVFEIYSDISRPIQAAIERIKLVGLAEPNELNIFVRTLTQNRYDGYLESILPVMFLQRKYDPTGFEKTVQIFPETEDFLGSLVLSDISSRTVQQKDLTQISVFEAELAAQVVWKNEDRDYKRLLEHLSSAEKFQTPLVLYVSAVKFANSSPAKAVNLLAEASKLQKGEKSDRLDVEADKIAGQAAQLAYNLFVQNSSNCQIAVEAFENYYTIADGKIAEELEYLYSVVLNNCGQGEEGKELLKKIADRPSENHRDRARLELTVYAIQQKQYGNPDQRSRLVKHFSSLIVNHSDCEYISEAMELLSEIIDEIDQIQEQTEEFPEMAQDCKKLAQFCYDCLDGTQKQQASLMLAEVSVFEANKNMEKLLEADKLLKNLSKDGTSDDVDFLRCRARLLAEQSKFDEAAKLWAQICKMRKSETISTNQRSWKWWRAKFYELDCWAKCPQTQKEEVLHTIEVLENSFPDIPPLWAEKINLLK